MKKTVMRFLPPVMAVALLAGFFTFMLAYKSGYRDNIGSDDAVSYTGKGEDVTDYLGGDYTVSTDGNWKMSVGAGGVVTVANNVTGQEWHNTSVDSSNPFSTDASELDSPFRIIYKSEREKDVVDTPQLDSVSKEQYKVYVDGKKLITEYVMGEWGDNLLLPYALPQSVIENDIQPQLSEDDYGYLLRRYTLYSYDTLGADIRDTVVSKAPGIKNAPLYILTDVSTEAQKTTTSDLLVQAGYTSENYARDKAVTGEITQKSNKTFKVVVEYWLENGQLVVNIPCSQMQYFSDNPLVSLDLMRFFGYAGQEDKGYYLIPAGSGGLINIGGKDDGNFSIPYYGQDQVKLANQTASSDYAALPVFGMAKNDGGFLAIIEQGAELCTLNVEQMPGASTIYPSFRIADYGDVVISSSKTASIFGQSAYQGDIRVRYQLFDHPTEYSAMANQYRKYLIDHNQLPAQTAQKPTSLLMEIVGNVQQEINIGGMFSVKKPYVITTWEQSSQICQAVQESGMDYAVKLAGFNSGGLYAQTPGRYPFEKALGSAADRQAFTDFLKTNTIPSFLDVNLGYSLNSSWLKGYRAQTMSAHTPDDMTATMPLPDKATGAPMKGIGTVDIVSPSAFAEIAGKYVKTIDSSYGLSIGDTALTINTDFNRSNYYDRNKSKLAMAQAASTLSDNRGLLSKSAADYLLSSVSMIEELSLSASDTYTFDNVVPFTQMVLHGYVPYTSSSMNYSADKQKALLESIETGSGLKYIVGSTVTRGLMKTPYNYLFPIRFADQKEEILRNTAFVDTALQGLYNRTIISHQICSPDVRKVTYDNGVVIYVNYGSTDFHNQDVTVPAQSYQRVG